MWQGRRDGGPRRPSRDQAPVQRLLSNLKSMSTLVSSTSVKWMVGAETRLQ